MLRGEAPMTEKFRQITHDIDQALLKLPTYQGTVYRSLSSTEMVDVEAFWERYTPNSFVIERLVLTSPRWGAWREGRHRPKSDGEMIVALLLCQPKFIHSPAIFS